MYQKLQVGRAVAVTPSDTDDIVLPGSTAATSPQSVNPRGCVLYVGGAGDLEVETIGGDVVVFAGVVAGSFIPVQVRKVRAATTATNILALW